jgi:sRNA-binding regulator protein Hfq
VLREIEQRYRSVGNDATIEKLAQYYDVPADELRWRQAWSRKGLSKALAAAQQQRIPLQVNLRTGQSLRGQVVWWDLGAALLELGDGRQVVVQRHMVDTWEPRAIEVESDIDL